MEEYEGPDYIYHPMNGCTLEGSNHHRTAWNTRPSELRQAGVDGEHPLGQGYVDALADTETADKIDDVLRYAKNAPKGDLYRAEYNKGWNDCLYFVADKMNAQPAAQKTPVDRQNQANLRDKEICTPQTISKATEGELIRCWELIKNTAVDEYDPISKNSGLLFKNHKTGNFAFISEPDLQAMEAALASRASVDTWQDIETAPKDGTQILVHCGGVATSICLARYKKAKTLRDSDMWVTNVWTEEIGFSKTRVVPTHWQPLPAAKFPDLVGRA